MMRSAFVGLILVACLCMALSCPTTARAQYEDLPDLCIQAMFESDPEAVLAHLLQCRQDPEFELVDGSGQAQVATEIGFAYARLGRFEEALDEFDLLVSVQDALGPGGTAHHDRGMVYRSAGYHDLALADFTAAIEAAPTAEDYLQRGATYETLGQPELAAPDYAAALELDPENVRAANCLAWLLATTKDPDLRDGEAALELAHQLVEHTPNSTHVDTLAAALACTGHFEEAVETQELALDMAQQEMAQQGRGDQDYLNELIGRLELYRQGQAYIGR